MTKLEKNLSRVVEVAGNAIVVTLVPEDAGIPAHIKFRREGDKKSFRSVTIDPPSTGELARK